MPSDALNNFLLELYRASRETPARHFQAHALDLLQSLIRFDSAWWGNASANPLKIHQMFLHNCEESLIETYSPFMEEDFFRTALLENPGASINMADLVRREDYISTPLYREWGRNYRIEWSLGTLQIEPVSSLFEFLTLWRHDPTHPFNEDERRNKEAVMPHLIEAFRNNRLHQLAAARVPDSAWALADERGYLRDVTPGFIKKMRMEWPEWNSSALPPGLAKKILAGKSHSGRMVKVDVTRYERFRYLTIRPLSAVDRLGKREHQVGERYALGATYQQIATELGVSPATIRNHIASCFRKLSVKNKIELIKRLNA